jgi:hypothetical protein
MEEILDKIKTFKEVVARISLLRLIIIKIIAIIIFIIIIKIIKVLQKAIFFNRVKITLIIKKMNINLLNIIIKIIS